MEDGCWVTRLSGYGNSRQADRTGNWIRRETANAVWTLSSSSSSPHTKAEIRSSLQLLLLSLSLSPLHFVGGARERPSELKELALAAFTCKLCDDLSYSQLCQCMPEAARLTAFTLHLFDASGLYSTLFSYSAIFTLSRSVCQTSLLI